MSDEGCVLAEIAIEEIESVKEITIEEIESLKKELSQLRHDFKSIKREINIINFNLKNPENPLLFLKGNVRREYENDNSCSYFLINKRRDHYDNG